VEVNGFLDFTLNWDVAGQGLSDMIHTIHIAFESNSSATVGTWCPLPGPYTTTVVVTPWGLAKLEARRLTSAPIATRSLTPAQSTDPAGTFS